MVNNPIFIYDGQPRVIKEFSLFELFNCSGWLSLDDEEKGMIMQMELFENSMKEAEDDLFFNQLTK